MPRPNEKKDDHRLIEAAKFALKAIEQDDRYTVIAGNLRFELERREGSRCEECGALRPFVIPGLCGYCAADLKTQGGDRVRKG